MINTKILKKRKKELKISTNKIALLTNLGYATVYDLLSGKIKNPRLETVVKIVKVLELNINDILI